MSGFAVTDLADEDIRQAAEYLDKESGGPEAGNKLMDRLNKEFARIAAAPYMGRLRPDLEPDLRRKTGDSGRRDSRTSTESSTT